MDREPRIMWTDARMDDFARDVNERLRALSSTNERLGVIDRDIGNVRTDVAECRTAIQLLSDQFSKRSEAREAERKERERDRKIDRRWLVGTVLTAAAIVVAAIGVLVQALP